VDLVPRRSEAVANTRREAVEEVIDDPREELRLPNSVTGLDPDPILDYLTGLPEFELTLRELAGIERRLFMLLPKRQHVSIEHLLLSGYLSCP
jgi:hypothetical protein